jgi:predicted Zn-dependent protease
MDPASIAFAALAEEYRRAGRFDEAIATCVAGLKRHPSYLSARITLGRALIGAGRYDEAQQEMERTLRTAPENLAAISGLAEIHQHRGAGETQGTPASADNAVQLRALERLLRAIQIARTPGESRPN